MSSKKSNNRRPPIEHQFKPGQSGNRAGRPKGSRNKIIHGSLARIVLQEAAREAPAHKGVSAHRAVVRKLFEQAAQGDLSSANAILFMAAESEMLVAAIDAQAEAREEAAAAAERKRVEAAEDAALAAEVAAEDHELYRFASALAGAPRRAGTRFADVLEEARARIALGITLYEEVDPLLLALTYAEHKEGQE